MKLLIKIAFAWNEISIRDYKCKQKTKTEERENYTKRVRDQERENEKWKMANGKNCCGVND